MFNPTYSNLIGLQSVENLKLTWLHLFWHLNCVLTNDVDFEHIRQFSSYADKQSHSVSSSTPDSTSTTFPSILKWHLRFLILLQLKFFLPWDP